jgi:hypothetical protein
VTDVIVVENRSVEADISVLAYANRIANVIFVLDVSVATNIGVVANVNIVQYQSSV